MQSLQDYLETLREIIIAHQSANGQHEPTSTEYFALIVSTITSGGESVTETLPMMLKVLMAVMPTTSSSVLRSQFKPLGHTLMTIMQQYGKDTSNEGVNVLASALTCLGKLLVAQELSDTFWSQGATLQSVNALLAFLDDDTPKVRKASHEAIITLLAHHAKEIPMTATENNKGLRAYFTDFSLGVIKACTRSSYKRGHSLVVLLESVLIHLLPHQSQRVLEASLNLHRCEIPRLTAAVYRMLDTFYQAPYLPSRYVSSSEVIVLSLESCLSSPPSSADVETNVHYYNALASGLIVLQKLTSSPSIPQQQQHQGLKHMKAVMEVLINHGCDSEYTQVHTAVGASMKRIVQFIINDSIMKECKKWLEQSYGEITFDRIPKAVVNKKGASSIPIGVVAMYELIHAMECVLELKYQSSWLYLLDSMRCLFDFLRQSGYGREDGTAFYFMSPLIAKMSAIQHAIEHGVVTLSAETTASLKDTLGSGLQCLGLTSFLEIVPIFADSNNEDPNATSKLEIRDWVIDLLAYELKNMYGNISDFMLTIYPIIEKIQQLIEMIRSKISSSSSSSSSTAKEIQMKMLHGKVIRLWSLFPEVCHGRVIDLMQSFPKLSGILVPLYTEEMYVTHYPELAFIATISLGRLAKSCAPSTTSSLAGLSASSGAASAYPHERALLSKEAINYLPLLLKYIESVGISDGRFKEILNAISSWIAIAPENVISKISTQLLRLVLMNTNVLKNEGESTMVKGLGDSSKFEDAAMWMAVILAMVPYMSASLIVILYKTIRPLLSIEESITIQKRAYNLLHALLLNHPTVVFTQIESRLDLVRLLNDSLLTAHISSRNMRLKCIECLIESSQNDNDEDEEKDNEEEAPKNEIMSIFELILGEVLICQKDSNKKTREEAYKILKTCSRRLPPVEVFTKLCAALVAETSLMRSSSINALCLHLLEQFHIQRDQGKRGSSDDGMIVSDDEELGSDDSGAEEEDEEDDEENGDDEEGEGTKKMKSKKRGSGSSTYVASSEEYNQLIQYSLDLLPSITLLLSQQCSDQTKSALAYMKLLISIASKEQLSAVIPMMIHAFCNEMSPQLKAKFSSRNRAILRKLLRKFSDEELRPLIPQADIALLDYISKQNRKALRKKQGGTVAGGSVVGKGGMNTKKSVYDQLLGSDSEDEEDNGSINGGAKSAYEASIMDRGEQDYRFQKSKIKGIVANGSRYAGGSMMDFGDGDNSDEDAGDGGKGRGATISRKRARREFQEQQQRNLPPSALALKAMNFQQQLANKKNAAAAAADGDDEDFQVMVGADGKVTIKAKEQSGLGQGKSRLGSVGQGSAKGGPGGLGNGSVTSQTRGNQNKKRKLLNLREPGAEYRSKKAGGDVWKKGVALQPHAYIPLDPRLLSKKNQKAAVEHFGVVVDSSKNNRRKVKALRRK